MTQNNRVRYVGTLVVLVYTIAWSYHASASDENRHGPPDKPRVNNTCELDHTNSSVTPCPFVGESKLFRIETGNYLLPGHFRESSQPAAKMTQDTIYFDVPLIPQPTKCSCWAASMAMLLSFHKKAEIDPEEVAREIGLSLRTSYDVDVQMDAFEHFGFRSIILPSEMTLYPSPQEWHDWLDSYGPLYVSIVGDPAHAIVVCGISGDLTPEGTRIHILDPMGGPKEYDNDPIDFHPPNRGVRAKPWFKYFSRLFGNLESSGDWRILYLPKED